MCPWQSVSHKYLQDTLSLSQYQLDASSILPTLIHRLFSLIVVNVHTMDNINLFPVHRIVIQCVSGKVHVSHTCLLDTITAPVPAECQFYFANLETQAVQSISQRVVSMHIKDNINLFPVIHCVRGKVLPMIYACGTFYHCPSTGSFCH